MRPLPGFARDHRIALACGMTPAEVVAHALECDGETGPPPYPGMNDQPCIVCRASAWERWNRDPYGMFHGPARRCKCCGGDRRDADARKHVLGDSRQMLDGRYWPTCYSCGGPVQARDDRSRALDMDWCIAVRRGELTL